MNKLIQFFVIFTIIYNSNAFKFKLEFLEDLLPLNILKPENWNQVLKFSKNNYYTAANEAQGKSQFNRGDVEKSPEVYVGDFGSVVGKVIKSFSGRDFYSYQSIPYALPPVGERRFQMPEAWTGKYDDTNEYFDASYIRSKCPQMSVLGVPAGDEDCLHLNVYTPALSSNLSELNLPVMFYIHGGSFVSGDATFYVPTKLMDADVVVVTIQYRLGSLGFLASETPENPGNMGLMDQITALRWVQKYISNFGGDSDLVTVFGQSAGSASSAWMQFTPATKAERNGGKQLLHRAILQSGNTLDTWAHDPNPEHSFELHARATSCWSEEPYGHKFKVSLALQCMRDVPLDDIIMAFDEVYLNDRGVGGLGMVGVCPIIQINLARNYPDAIANNSDLLVLPENSYDMMVRGDFLKIPILAGNVRDEGSTFLGYVYEEYLAPNNLSANELFLRHNLLPRFVKTLRMHDRTNAAGKSFELAFLKHARMGNFSSMTGGLIDFVGFSLIKTSLWEMALALANYKSDIFFYSFELESDDSLFQWFFNGQLPFDGGITHGDELPYLFYLPSYMNDVQKKTVSRVVTAWSNFAKYGDPTPENNTESWVGKLPEWKRCNLQDQYFMLIKEDFRLEQDFSNRWNHNSEFGPFY